MTCPLLCSFAGRWSLSAGLPTEWTLRTWKQNSTELLSLETTASLGVAVTGDDLVTLSAPIKCQPGPNQEWWIYLKPILPQLAFLFEIRILSIFHYLKGAGLLVLWMHLIYMLPHTSLLLAELLSPNQLRFRGTAQLLGQSSGESSGVFNCICCAPCC